MNRIVSQEMSRQIRLHIDKVKELFKYKKPIVRRFSLCGKEIPQWCVGDAVNISKHNISEEQKTKIRNWYLQNTPESIEVIEHIVSNWIGREFGTQYYSASSINDWNGFRLYIGNNTYVKLY